LAYGLLLTLVWVQLQGLDVALIEGAVGGGLTGVLVIGAAVRLRGTQAAADAARLGMPARILAALLSGGVAAVIAACVLALPDPAPTLAPRVSARMAATGVANPVTAVLLAFRALDTLLEAIVLVLALIGVWSLAPDRVWGGRPAPRYDADPDGILAYVARILPPIGIVAGIYIFWAGADHPGRQVPRRDDSCGHVASCHAGWPGRCAAGRPIRARMRDAWADQPAGCVQLELDLSP
jgi:multisubunit Na+/H+ antiporter MnhB subunit